MNPDCPHCKILFNQLMTCVQSQAEELLASSKKGYWQKLWDAIKGR